MRYWFEIAITVASGILFFGLRFLLWQDEKEIKALNQQIQDLKCCGNCRINNILYIEGVIRKEHCRYEYHADASREWCAEWKYDGLKQTDRQIT